MKSIQLKSSVGKDGILNIQIPVDMPEQEIEILLVIQPIHKQTEKQYQPLEKLKKGWPDNFFENVVGAWSGDLIRPSQGDLEIREEL
jgi:hypothetical protein